MTDIESLFKNDPQLKDAAAKRAALNAHPSEHDLAHTVKHLEKFNNVIVVDDEKAALEAVKSKIPKGATVNTCGSATLGEIGFTDALKENKEGWVNVKEVIVAEQDKAKQETLRRTIGSSCDVLVSSLYAVDHFGRLYTCCASGNRSLGLLGGSEQLILVVGVNKIVKDHKHAAERLAEYVLPLESARARVAYAAYGVQGSASNFKAEIQAGNPFASSKRITVILVKKTLGF